MEDIWATLDENIQSTAKEIKQKAESQKLKNPKSSNQTKNQKAKTEATSHQKTETTCSQKAEAQTKTGSQKLKTPSQSHKVSTGVGTNPPTNGFDMPTENGDELHADKPSEENFDSTAKPNGREIATSPPPQSISTQVGFLSHLLEISTFPFYFKNLPSSLVRHTIHCHLNVAFMNTFKNKIVMHNHRPIQTATICR